MNRRERRLASKRLGILQYQQKLPFSKKAILIAENNVAGKQMHEQFVEECRIDVNAQLEEKESQVIYSMAEIIAAKKHIPVIDAMNEAQKLYSQGLTHKI